MKEEVTFFNRQTIHCTLHSHSLTMERERQSYEKCHCYLQIWCCFILTTPKPVHFTFQDPALKEVLYCISNCTNSFGPWRDVNFPEDNDLGQVQINSRHRRGNGNKRRKQRGRIAVDQSRHTHTHTHLYTSVCKSLFQQLLLLPSVTVIL